ncbi:thiosulfate sulfurtransferase 16, chloroplastic [Macadamia integrifolia]|uniref:thiosulfate sulfurtransferase 16, chloroplastic n=1 Tax=Macadamia integrifolia TaxID=60698 RepID=UPI001C4FB5F0|nr:thiosulfate sulfurtransferase 16, chloroplastic [Macadamia integrifolia]
MAVFTQNLNLPNLAIQTPNSSWNVLRHPHSQSEFREKSNLSPLGKREMAIACFTRSALPRVLRPQNLNFRHLSSNVTPLPFQLPTIQSDGIVKRRFTCRSIADAAGENSESSGVPKSVPVRVAHELLQAGHRYLDVRTPEEFGAGHPSGAINVPYMFRAGVGMTKNPKFLVEVSSNFGKDSEIIVGCQSGKRSLMAATELVNSGYTGVTDIAGGYSAWVQNGLPTEL